ncbi:hypothetical protein [Bacillus sp. JJ722]|uniref:hypothetical protein n=1 Tax=Bacillus sp. JJ722 TaxID=3122973 RepID=UPI002FFE6259
MKWLLPFIVIVSLLISCEDDSSVNGGTEGYITQFVKDDLVLIGDTIYNINSDTQLQTSDGESLKKSDLKIGMKVQPFYKETLEETFPAKGDAKLLRVLTDEESLKESVMMINVLHQLKHNEDEHFIITNVVHAEGVYEMDVMRRSNVDIGFTITVDDESYEILYMEA